MQNYYIVTGVRDGRLVYAYTDYRGTAAWTLDDMKCDRFPSTRSGYRHAMEFAKRAFPGSHVDAEAIEVRKSWLRSPKNSVDRL